jgi:hypothetical protein
MDKPRTQPDEVNSGKYLIHLFVCLLMVGLISAMVRTLMPLLSVVVPIAFGWWAWRSHQRTQKKHRERLNTIFYELLQDHDGKMTVLDFAMTAQLSASEARQFLNDRAKEFSAHFEVSEQGDVIYRFQTLKVPQKIVQPAIVVDEVLSRKVERSTEPKLTVVPSISPLTQNQLAQRFNLSPTTISRKKASSDFVTWSKTKDPQGIAWNYSAATQRFYPEDL